ncbi:MAG: oxygenase MpaB family protein [Cyclobacteriaceae bacterium]
MDRYRQMTDTPGDAAINELIKSLPKEEIGNLLSYDSPSAEYPEAYQSFKNEYIKLPPVANMDKIVLAGKVYRKYTQEIMMLLGAMSLPYCYAAANGARVLFMSEKIRTDPSKRLLETAQFVLGLFGEGAFENEGAAYDLITKTRLRHALVRFFIQHKPWDEAWGKPINQEDLAGTNLAFSLIIIKGLDRLGFRLTLAEKEAWMHNWYVIGYMLGIEEGLLYDDIRQASHLERVIARRQLRTSDQGKALTASLIAHLKASLPDSRMSTLVDAQIRLLLDDQIADMLGVKPGKLPLRIARAFTDFQYIRNQIAEPKASYDTFQKELRKKAHPN